MLFKLEFFRSLKGLVMTLVISFGILYFLGLLMSPVFDPGLLVFDHLPGYAFVLIVGGFVLSSLAFSDLSNNLKRYRYLTLPVSTLEKFLCMWLLTTAGWIVLFTLFYSGYTVFANVTARILFKHMTFIAFDPLSADVANTIRYYIVFQGIFLAGSVHFKGYVLPKTLFTLIIFGAVCGAVIYFMMSDMFQAEVDSFSDPNTYKTMSVYKIWQVIVWLFWWLLAPLSWIITYLGLKEKEV
jgi:hypothetical protein